MNRIILLLLVSHAALAQPVVKKLSSIPPAIRYTGEIKNAVTWKDNAGEHFVLTTETLTQSTETRGAALYAYHYLKTSDSLTQTWRVYDYIKECPYDVIAKFVKNSFAITDLDKNGVAETWLMYTTVCRSDVSPSYMKVIMYEGNKKYAMRGQTKTRVSETEFTGGQYTFDEAFKKAPAVFRDYAQKLWKKNIMEDWGE